jgi:hypothetical protein
MDEFEWAKEYETPYIVELLDAEYNHIKTYPIPEELMPYRNERNGVNRDGYLIHEFEDYKRTLVFGNISSMTHEEMNEGLSKLDLPFSHLNPHTVLSIDIRKYTRELRNNE